MTKKYGPPSGADIIAAEFRRRGLDFNLERLEDRVTADKSRQKINDAAHVERVEAAAVATKKARRACELAEWEWRRKPNSDTLAAARATQETRNSAEAELREICLQDEELISAVQRRIGR